VGKKMNESRRISLVLVAVLLAVPVVWVSESHAQTGSPGAPPGVGSMRPQGAPPGAGGMQRVQGVIKSVDPSGKLLTLDDGTKLTIPPSVNVPRGMLEEGTIVKATYEEKGGQNVVTSLEVQQK
jgi:hypothetical protein